MKYNKSIISLFILLVLVSFSLKPAYSQILKIEPQFWWTGMKNTNLQLLIYGKNISNLNPKISNSDISIKSVIKVKNPNYLFINLNINKTTTPGTYRIEFYNNNILVQTIEYELKKRNTSNNIHKGFNQTDVIYLLMPDRFANGDTSNDNVKSMLEKSNRSNPNGRHGGDIKGISEHIDYIKELGVTTLWINPLLENNMDAYSYHGYAITDFYNIDKRFGTNKDYVNLVNKCHTNNLKVIMDVVLNHCGSNHYWIKDLPMDNWIHQFPEYTSSNFRGSSIMDPYASDFDKNLMTKGWFDKTMPDLNQNNDLLLTYLIQNTIWWIEFAELDGIRLDTQPYSSKESIAKWAKSIILEYPNINIVGETWLQKISHTAYWQKNNDKNKYNSNIPSITDFPLYYSINNSLNEKQTWTEGISRLYYSLSQDYLYNNPEKNLAFLDNHDLTRFFSSVHEDIGKFKLGITFLLTTNRIPMIYYGTEILMTGFEHDGHGSIRKDFPGGWANDKTNGFTGAELNKNQIKTFNFTKKLLNWRKNCETIHYGKLKHFVPENEVYVYFRYDNNNTYMIILNNDSKNNKTLETSKYSEVIKTYTKAVNILTGDSLNDISKIKIPANTPLILKLEK